MNCLLSGAIARIGGAQKRADGVAGAKYSLIRVIFEFILFLAEGSVADVKVTRIRADKKGGYAHK